MAEENSFRELFQRAVDGDRDAQADLYLEYGKDMRRWIEIKLRRMKIAWAVEPDDVLDSFFVRIIAGRVTARFNNPRHFAMYCEKSLLNKCRQTLRSVILRRAKNIAECPSELFEDEGAANDLESFSWDERLEEAYSMLSQLERVICFYRLDDYSWEEIGRRLGKSTDAVRKVHQRAAERLGSATRFLREGLVATVRRTRTVLDVLLDRAGHTSHCVFGGFHGRLGAAFPQCR